MRAEAPSTVPNRSIRCAAANRAVFDWNFPADFARDAGEIHKVFPALLIFFNSVLY